jgi:hypothetical protein
MHFPDATGIMRGLSKRERYRTSLQLGSGDANLDIGISSLRRSFSAQRRAFVIAVTAKRVCAHATTGMMFQIDEIRQLKEYPGSAGQQTAAQQTLKLLPAVLETKASGYHSHTRSFI